MSYAEIAGLLLTICGGTAAALAYIADAIRAAAIDRSQLRAELAMERQRVDGIGGVVKELIDLSDDVVEIMTTSRNTSREMQELKTDLRREMDEIKHRMENLYTNDFLRRAQPGPTTNL